MANVLRGLRMDVDAYPLSDLSVHVVREKVSNSALNELMEAGWTIMATWIEDPNATIILDDYITDISIRLGKRDERIILLSDVPMAVMPDVVPNIDANTPGESAQITTGVKGWAGVFKIRQRAKVEYVELAILSKM